MRTTLVAAIVSSLIGFSVHTVAQAAIRRATNIPAEPLSVALRALVKDRDVQIVYPSELLENRNTHGAAGELTLDEALTQVLRGTGLAYKYLDEQTVTIVAVRSGSAATGSAGSAPGATPGNSAADRSESDGVRGSSVWDRFRPLLLAQTDQGSSVDTSGTGSSAPRPVQLEEVLVTAQKREERLHDVPVAVSVIKADNLEENNQVMLRDLNGMVPGLTESAGNQSGQGLSIRGLSSGTYQTPSAGVTLDDVPLTPIATGIGSYIPDIDPSDIARIEVLRGPQGTLYGADSLGGLVKYVTIDPSTSAFSGRMQAGISTVSNGDKPGYNIRGSLNIPLGDTLAMRVSAYKREDPGYIDNVATGQDAFNINEVAGGRIAALWTPSDTVSLKVSALYQHMKGYEPQAFTPTPGYPNTAGLGSLQSNAFAGNGEYDRTFQAYSAILTAHLGLADLTSVTGYSAYRAGFVVDGSNYLGPGIDTDSNQTAFVHRPAASATTQEYVLRKVSEEIRLASKPGSTLDWLVGGIFTSESLPSRSNTVFLNAVAPGTGAFIATGYFVNLPGSLQESAGFADVIYHLTDRFDIQVGGRESFITRGVGTSYTIAPEYNLPGSVTPGIISKANVFNYLASPQFKFTHDVMMYARFASGYSGGGPNNTYAQTGIPSSFGPERTKDYELGLKADMLEQRLSVDAALYYISFDDIQLQGFSPLGGYIVNGGKAKSQGVELSATGKPMSGLSLSGWVTVGDAELTEAIAPTLQEYGVAGTRLPFANRFSANVSADEEFPLGNRLNGFFGGTVSYVGDRQGNLTNRLPDGSPPPRSTFPAYAKLDLHGGVRYDSWTIQLYANNVGDRRAIIGGGLGDFPPFSRVYIQPRTIGLNAIRTF